tara:strand:- start:166 stop:732 length:567 start_codon:yes stop_codon:yes gene_type:complete
VKVGDNVRVINENAEGVISKLEGSTAWIEIEGMDFPYQIRDLLVVDSNEEELLEHYEKHTPRAKNVKSDDLPKLRPMTEKERIEELGRVRGKRNSKGILEFDLHIHDLLVKHDHMTPGEMLNYQLDYAVHCMEEVIKKREPSLIFIHGVGKGVLRSELHNIIKSYGFTFNDGFMREYGMGATKVELRG